MAVPQAAVEVRKQVNQLDNLTTSKAVDALLNAETVALFGNRQLEVRGSGKLRTNYCLQCSSLNQSVHYCCEFAGAFSSTDCVCRRHLSRQLCALTCRLCPAYPMMPAGEPV